MDRDIQSQAADHEPADNPIDDLWGPTPDNDPTDGQLAGTPSEGRVVRGDEAKVTNPDVMHIVAPADHASKVDDVDAAVKQWQAAQTVATYKAGARAIITPAGVPASLQAVPRWVLWRFEPAPGRDKPRKVPLRLDGTHGSSTDPTSWARFSDVLAAYNAAHSGADGIGFVFTDDDDIVGIDLDGCRDPVTGQLAPWARSDLDTLGSWAEVSPTGTGVHVFARGRLASGVKNKSGDGRREVYATGRYFTVTGQTVDGAPLDVIELPHLTDWHRRLFPSSLVSAPVPKPPMTTKTATPSRRPDKVERARAWLTRAGVAVSGENGHDVAMRVIGTVVRGFDLTADEAMRALKDWNDRCDPPWSDGELAHKVASALDTDDPRRRPDGWLLNEDRPRDIDAVWEVTAANDDDDPETASWRQEMRRAHEDLMAAMGTSSSSLSEPCPFDSYAALVRKDIAPMRWLVNGLITDGAVAVIAGEPKTAKTWLALEVAVSVALGDKVMGEFQTRRTGPVVLFLTEDHEASVRARLMSTVLGHAVDPHEATPPIFVKAKATLDLSDPRTLAWLVASIRRLPEPPALLVVDPLRNVLGPLKEADNDDMAKANAALRAVRDVLGGTVLYVHHTAKLTEAGAGRRAGQRMRGASALHGGYDAGIHLSAPTTTQDGRKTVMSATVEVEVKAGKAAAPFSFDLNIHDNDAGQCIRADWAHEGKTRQALGVDDAADKATAAILGVFRERHTVYRMTKTALAVESKGQRKARLSLVDALVDAGKLVALAGSKALEVWPKDAGEGARQTIERAWWTSGAHDADGRPFVDDAGLADFLVQNLRQRRGEVQAYLATTKHRRGDLLGELLADGFIERREPADDGDVGGWVMVDPPTVARLHAARAETGDRQASGG
jgi:hypothetical protein